MSSPRLLFNVLGPLTVTLDGRALPLGGAKQRSILALLLVDANAVVSVDRLIDEVWQDSPPDSARNALQVYISQLRRTLRAAIHEVSIRTQPPGYMLETSPEQIDSHRFHGLSKQGAAALGAGDPAEAVSALREALGLWRGDAFADLAFEPFVQPIVDRLEEERLLALEDRVDADLQLGRDQELLAELEAVVRRFPFRERFRAQLMLAMYRSGRQAEALQLYLDAQSILADELGIDPSPELTALYQAILHQEDLLPSPTIHAPQPRRRASVDAWPAGLAQGVRIGTYIPRDAVSRDLAAALDASAVVAVTGAPGSGKSRLVAEFSVGHHGRAVRYVDLSGVDDRPSLLLQVSRALDPARGGTDESALKVIAAECAVDVIILDPCDRVLSDVRAIGPILTSAGRRLVTVGREPAGISGERIVNIDPLDPAAAVELFIARATEADPDFSTVADRSTIEDVCAALDHLPLAVELAATRVRALPLDEVLASVRRSIATHPDADTTPLTAAIESSVAMLSDLQRRVLVRLSVFERDFDLAAARPVLAEVAHEDEVADVLFRLVAKSLLQPVTPQRPGRYRMLQPIRLYVRSNGEKGEIDEAARLHAHHFLDVVRRSVSRLDEPDFIADLPSLRTDLANVRAAVAWAASDNEDAGSRGSEDGDLAIAAARVALRLGDWDSVVDLVDRSADRGLPEALEMLGVARCQRAAAMPTSGEYREGQSLLERAAEIRPSAETLAALAGTWKGLDEDRAIDVCKLALDQDPSHPYALGNLLELEVARSRSLDIVRARTEAVKQALARSHDQAEHNHNLPWACYDVGRFESLLSHPNEALTSYLAAIHLSSARYMIETSLASVDRIRTAVDLKAMNRVQTALALALAAKFGDQGAVARLSALSSMRDVSLEPPIVIVAGSSKTKDEEQMTRLGVVMRTAFEGVTATIISGGTTAGVARVVGDVASGSPTLTAIGYLPGMVPAGVQEDADLARYRELRRTEGRGFSAQEPLSYWTDIVLSGIRPSDVRLVAASGGDISAVEYRLALALGAQVAIVDVSRQAGGLLLDPLWNAARNLRVLGDDPRRLADFLRLN